MQREVRIPKWGLTIDSMRIVEWNKKVGDSVFAGEVICAVSTNEESVKIESPADGVISEIIEESDGEYNAGTVIAVINVAAAPGHG